VQYGARIAAFVVYLLHHSTGRWLDKALN
jgi:hypothetical protein